MALVSFVIPCYNYGRYLRDCLDSIFAQEGCQDFEIIAINDASPDDTREILAGYTDPRVKVIHHETNQGHIVAVNEGSAAASGSFIARIDPDDRYRPGFLAAVLPKFQQYPDVGFVYGEAAVINGRGELQHDRTGQIPHAGDFKGNDYVALLRKNFICAPTTIARREAWQKVMPLPPRLAFNDWYVNLMIARRCDLYFVDQVLAEYRVHDSNHHSVISRDKTEEASIVWLLDLLYSQKEVSEELEEAKQRARRETYAAQYLIMADKYFQHSMNEDARRCYWNAVRRRPSCALRQGVLRRFLATLTNRQLYEAGKSLLKRRSSSHAS